MGRRCSAVWSSVSKRGSGARRDAMRERFWHLSVLLVALVVGGVVAQQAGAAEGGAARLMGRLQELVRQLRELRQPMQQFLIKTNDISFIYLFFL